MEIAWEDIIRNVKSLLRHYGNAVAIYQGTGLISFSNGGEHPCSFSAGQLPTGKIVLLCHLSSLAYQECILQLHSGTSIEDTLQFVGTIKEGLEAEVKSGIRTCDYLPKQPMQEDKSGLALALSRLHLRVLRSDPSRFLHYGVTNLKFKGDEPSVRLKGGTQLVLPSEIFAGGGIASIALHAVKDSDGLFSRAKTLRGTEVTTEIVIETTLDSDSDHHEVADALCFLLSVASGTKVQYKPFNEVSLLIISPMQHTR